jgi:hypothetical protein
MQGRETARLYVRLVDTGIIMARLASCCAHATTRYLPDAKRSACTGAGFTRFISGGRENALQIVARDAHGARCDYICADDVQCTFINIDTGELADGQVHSLHADGASVRIAYVLSDAVRIWLRVSVCGVLLTSKRVHAEFSGRTHGRLVACHALPCCFSDEYRTVIAVNSAETLLARVTAVTIDVFALPSLQRVARVVATEQFGNGFFAGACFAPDDTLYTSFTRWDGRMAVEWTLHAWTLDGMLWTSYTLADRPWVWDLDDVGMLRDIGIERMSNQPWCMTAHQDSIVIGCKGYLRVFSHRLRRLVQARCINTADAVDSIYDICSVNATTLLTISNKIERHNATRFQSYIALRTLHGDIIRVLQSSAWSDVRIPAACRLTVVQNASVAVCSDGSMLVSNYNNSGVIEVYDSDGHRVQNAPLAAHDFTQPRAMSSLFGRCFARVASWFERRHKYVPMAIAVRGSRVYAFEEDSVGHHMYGHTYISVFE